MFDRTAPSSAARHDPTSRRRRRAPLALVLATAALSTAGADVAAALAPVPAPVPCSGAGQGRYNCEFYPSAGAPVQAAEGSQVGTLHQGTNWVLCQRVGASVTNRHWYNNNWAYTLADNNQYGWVNAVYARGGDNNGPFRGVPGCIGTEGNPPGAAGSGLPPAQPALGTGRPLFEAPWPCGQTRAYSHHSREVSNALDFAGSEDFGTPALASAGGRVASARFNDGYGNEVVIDHGGGWSSRVAHLSRITVGAGQNVTPGQEVGKVGSTGRSSGPHLHYEQLSGGRRQAIVLGGQALLYSPQSTSIGSRPCR